MATEIKIPDIGDESLPAIEILVQVGDHVDKDAPLIVIESDKAAMEVPAPSAGTIASLTIKAGDEVKTGDVIGTLTVSESESAAESESESESAAESEVESAADSSKNKPEKNKSTDTKADTKPDTKAESDETVIDLVVPDIGDDAVPVIEIFVKPGDEVDAEASLLTLESDKAAMDMPAPNTGKIVSLTASVGDKLSTGDVIGQLVVAANNNGNGAPQSEAADNVADKAADKPENKSTHESVHESAHEPASTAKHDNHAAPIDNTAFRQAHASPSVRKFAREVGADLGQIKGTGRKSRITHDDVKAFIKSELSSKTQTSTTGTGIPPIPTQDFSKFGTIETQPLSRINKISSQHLTRCWLNIPHVTQNDEADITELENFRKSLKTEAEKQGVRVTMLSFLMKALVAAMQAYPNFNSSLAGDGDSLIIKKYYHIGIAVDTPNGLVVPVIRNVDQKNIYDLSRELMTLSEKARDGKLTPTDLQGGCMSISSLGGIGGTSFTPIVNAPEVAILGVSRSKMQPVWDGKAFVPRNILPLSLSYDHRVIDGADGARFTQHIAATLADVRRLLL
ncbi:dihydrolipoyllysine-residue acetyltransferase [Ostreibacterium oceani]|uniref:Acetyltransferase component of pyruvate dehydrogenase complex n=1 Tax=Ostreibacterium oceani TaxID=2654998 RepID=A0A6N7EXZ3_9GAMM|nr:dihydrolipoyllysine-residue acetyltransferase [Ostreibacterium oceani]MPV86259.1 dihydrolipoyllysine-residue acetyltransferase [Ostreibacterium oceani]